MIHSKKLIFYYNKKVFLLKKKLKKLIYENITVPGTQIFQKFNVFLQGLYTYFFVFTCVKNFAKIDNHIYKLL
jgi:hypothetical protein